MELKVTPKIRQIAELAEEGLDALREFMARNEHMQEIIRTDESGRLTAAMETLDKAEGTVHAAKNDATLTMEHIRALGRKQMDMINYKLKWDVMLADAEIQDSRGAQELAERLRQEAERKFQAAERRRLEGGMLDKNAQAVAVRKAEEDDPHKPHMEKINRLVHDFANKIIPLSGSLQLLSMEIYKEIEIQIKGQVKDKRWVQAIEQQQGEKEHGTDCEPTR